ncbi:unnamed protein product, partial [Iphiclides podalirius]
MSADPLVFVPVNRWSELKDLFKSDWPRSISGFTILENLERILQLGLDYGFKVYCPFGDLSNGMVALNVKNTYYEVVVQIANDDTQRLEEALNNTKLIDWSQSVEVPFAPKHVMDCVRKDVRLQKELTFKLLSLEYVEQVDSVWPHRYPGSLWYFELLTRANLGYGLFNGDKLIAWVFIKEMGALGHLYTLEEHRRKGYGELVLKLISNILLKQGKYVVAFCLEGNTSAYKLYTKLGFQRTDEIEWCTMTAS